MTEWTVQLEFAEGTSSKFWRARVDGKTLYVNYGKIGSNGQTQVKEFGDAAAATAEYDKLNRDKRKKGYLDAGAAGATGPRDDDGSDDGDDEAAARPARKLAARSAATAAAPRPAAAAPVPASSTPGHRMRLDAGNRKVETTLYLDGNAVRMDAREQFASPDAARQAFERLKQLLGSDGYKDG